MGSTQPRPSDEGAPRLQSGAHPRTPTQFGRKLGRPTGGTLVVVLSLLIAGSIIAGITPRASSYSGTTVVHPQGKTCGDSCGGGGGGNGVCPDYFVLNIAVVGGSGKVLLDGWASNGDTLNVTYSNLAQVSLCIGDTYDITPLPNCDSYFSSWSVSSTLRILSSDPGEFITSTSMVSGGHGTLTMNLQSGVYAQVRMFVTQAAGTIQVYDPENQTKLTFLNGTTGCLPILPSGESLNLIAVSNPGWTFEQWYAPLENVVDSTSVKTGATVTSGAQGSISLLLTSAEFAGDTLGVWSGYMSEGASTSVANGTITLPDTEWNSGLNSEQYPVQEVGYWVGIGGWNGGGDRNLWQAGVANYYGPGGTPDFTYLWAENLAAESGGGYSTQLSFCWFDESDFEEILNNPNLAPPGCQFSSGANPNYGIASTQGIGGGGTVPGPGDDVAVNVSYYTVDQYSTQLNMSLSWTIDEIPYKAAACWYNLPGPPSPFGLGCTAVSQVTAPGSTFAEWIAEVPQSPCECIGLPILESQVSFGAEIVRAITGPTAAYLYDLDYSPLYQWIAYFDDAPLPLSTVSAGGQFQGQ